MFHTRCPRKLSDRHLRIHGTAAARRRAGPPDPLSHPARRTAKSPAQRIRPIPGRLLVTKNIDHSRLGRLRQGQGEIANHVIDEFAAGRLSRRDFIRRATVVGISVPLLGSILAACSSSSSSSSASGSSSSTSAAAARRARRGDQGRHHHADRGDQPGDRRRPGRARHARADRRVPVPVRPDPDPEAGAGHELVAELHRRRLDVQDPPGRQVPQRRPADRRRRGVHLQAARTRSTGRPRCPRSPRAQAVRRGEGRRLHGGLPPGGPERELPVPGLLRQLQHDHHPEQLQPGQAGRARSSAPGRSCSARTRRRWAPPSPATSRTGAPRRCRRRLSSPSTTPSPRRSSR